MFIEQIIEFELKGPGALDRTCNSKTGYFYDKTKIFNRLRAPGLKATSAEAYKEDPPERRRLKTSKVIKLLSYMITFVRITFSPCLF